MSETRITQFTIEERLHLHHELEVYLRERCERLLPIFKRHGLIPSNGRQTLDHFTVSKDEVLVVIEDYHGGQTDTVSVAIPVDVFEKNMEDIDRWAADRAVAKETERLALLAQSRQRAQEDAEALERRDYERLKQKYEPAAVTGRS